MPTWSLLPPNCDGRRRAVLLRAELKRAAVVQPRAEEAAIQIRRLVARRNVGAGFGVRVPHAPASQIHADFVGRLLDRRVFRRPEVDLRQVEDAAGSRVDRDLLEPVVEHANAAHVAEVRSDLRRRKSIRLRYVDTPATRSSRSATVSAPVANSESRGQYSRRPTCELLRILGVRERGLDLSARMRARRIESTLDELSRSSESARVRKRGFVGVRRRRHLRLDRVAHLRASGAVQNGPGQQAEADDQQYDACIERLSARALARIRRTCPRERRSDRAAPCRDPTRCTPFRRCRDAPMDSLRRTPSGTARR